MARITVVEDYRDLAELICCAFERKRGVRCLSLSSFSEVKSHQEEVLQSEAIIIDINLGPKEPDGVDVHDWLRQMAYKGSIFFLSGHASNSPFAQRAAQTRLPILQKPMSTNLLIETVMASIDSGKKAES